MFEATISTTMLLGSTTWVLTKTLERRVQGAERRMLRLVVGHKRRQVVQSSVTFTGHGDTVATESWIAWVKRTTHTAEDKLAELGIRSWVDKHKVAKWKWAERLGRMAADRWVSICAAWTPEINAAARRAPGRPCLRWEDDIAILKDIFSSQ